MSKWMLHCGKGFVNYKTDKANDCACESVSAFRSDSVNAGVNDSLLRGASIIKFLPS